MNTAMQEHAFGAVCIRFLEAISQHICFRIVLEGEEAQLVAETMMNTANGGAEKTEVNLNEELG